MNHVVFCYKSSSVQHFKYQIINVIELENYYLKHHNSIFS